MPPKVAVLAPGSVKIGTGKSAIIFTSKIWSNSDSTYMLEQQKADRAQLLEDGLEEMTFELILRDVQSLQNRSRIVMANGIIKHEMARRAHQGHPVAAQAESASTALRPTNIPTVKGKAKSPTASQASTSPEPKVVLGAKANRKSKTPPVRTPSPVIESVEADTTREGDDQPSKKDAPTPSKALSKGVKALAIKPSTKTPTKATTTAPLVPLPNIQSKTIKKSAIKATTKPSTPGAKTAKIRKTVKVVVDEAVLRRSARLANKAAEVTSSV